MAKGKENQKSGYVVVSGFNDISDFGKRWHEGDDVSHFDDDRLESLITRKLVQAPKEDAKAKAAAEKEAADKAKANASK
jgi:putative ubiquitin-RnfH superfamily antitoxin RatB of RatAB toxin-antitoxin module